MLATGPADGGGTWLVGVRRSYVDAVLAAANVDMGLAPSYADAQIRWESRDRRWMVELWGQNITDAEYMQVAFNAPLQTGSYNAFLGAPRTYGVTLRLSY